MLFSFCDATLASTVGGSLSDKLTAVPGRNTLPALPVGGRPSAPMIDSAGRHARLRISSVGIVADGTRVFDERKLRADVVADHRGAGGRLLEARFGNRRVEFRREHLAGRLVLDAAQQLAHDAEAVGHDAAGVAGMHALGEHFDLEPAADQSAQRSRQP